MGFSFLPVMEYLSRRAFVAAGLCPHMVTLSCNPGEGGRGAGTTIHYWAPPGEPLLLIHGFGPMATWQWRRQAAPFSRHFHFIVPDLLCFGGSSPCPSCPPPSESAQAAALAALLDALSDLDRTARVAVAGTSYSGGPEGRPRGDIQLRPGQDGGRRQDVAPARRRLMEVTFYRRQVTPTS